MHRCLGLFSCALAVGMLAVTALPATASAAGGSPVSCAGATTTTTGKTAPSTTATIAPGSQPSHGSSCWEEIKPYPFGSLGEAVNTSTCAPGSLGGSPQVLEKCYLTVTSMAFRAWNRGLAATRDTRGTELNPFGVWVFNGTAWHPAPGFPGSAVCRGNTVLWGGKRDYWLVGGEKWADPCRFDGEHFEWEPLELPEATLKRITPAPTEATPHPEPKPGTITSAACFAWNNCWFFGTYGTVLHWDGRPPLTDASPARSESSLQAEYTGAVARQNPAGEPLGLAVGTTSEAFDLGPLLKEATGAAPPELFASSGEAFGPLAFTPFTIPETNDPSRTDLVAVDLDATGQGWVAGNPAGLRLREREGEEPRGPNDAPEQTRRPEPPGQPQPSPLEPVSMSGAAGTCEGPPSNRFTYTPFTNATDAFLWSSIAVVPEAGEALAGGQMRRAEAGAGPDEDTAVGEPVIVRADCEGTTAVTRFRIEDPSSPHAQAPADREGGVTATAANALNDAWVATSKGALRSGFEEEPRLYRLTNGQPVEAPEGNDEEERPPEEEPEPVTIVLEPPPPPPPPEPPATVTQTHTVNLPAAVYDVKAKLHTARRHGRLYLSLYLTFKLRRPVTIGAQALRRGHVVSVARPRHFGGHAGRLILSLERKRWPTKVRFIS